MPFKPSHLFLLPLTGPILIVSLLAGMMQGFGLAMFVPLLQLLNSSPEKIAPPFSYIRDAYEFLGVPFEATYLLVAIVISSVVGLGLTFAQRTLVISFAFTLYVQKTTKLVIDALLGSSWHHMSRQTTGEVINQIVVEVHRAGRALTQLVSSVVLALQLVIFLGFSFLLSPELLLVALCFGVLMYLVVLPVQRRSNKLGKELSEANRIFSLFSVDYLQNLKLVKATAMEPFVAGKITELQRMKCVAIARNNINLNLANFLIQTLPVLLVAFVIGTSSGYLPVETSSMLVFLIFLVRMVPLATNFQQEVQSYQMTVSAIDIVDQAIIEHDRHRELERPNAKPFSVLEDKIEFRGVSYSFPESHTTAVEAVNLEIKRGAMVAFVGPSGAGKSTMIDLLCGLRAPTRGDILIDGVSISDVDQESWRHRIGYVTQDTVVFNDTIENNIRFVHPTASQLDIDCAIGLAYLKDVINDLPEGMQTQMGEGGIRLSGGQKQRLALARALVGEPQVLLLDEATSSLDSESEKSVQKAVESLAHKFTIVVVAHRLSTVKNADIIFVMDQGRLVEHGSFRDLMNKGGRFSELYEV